VVPAGTGDPGTGPGDRAAALGCHRTNLFRPLKLAIRLGKVKKVGTRQGYIALPVR
jgi:hypothetical protein